MKNISFHPEELRIIYQVVNQGYKISIQWDGEKLIVEQSGGGEFLQYYKEITPSCEEWEEFWFMWMKLKFGIGTVSIMYNVYMRMTGKFP